MSSSTAYNSGKHPEDPLPRRGLPALSGKPTGGNWSVSDTGSISYSLRDLRMKALVELGHRFCPAAGDR